MERYIVMRILLGVFLLFVVTFFIVRLAGNDSEPADEPAVVEQSFVLSEQTNPRSEVELQVIGKTNAAEDHREFRFRISESRRLVELLEGYNGKVIKSTRLPNTPNAYAEFLYAIEAEGFTSERENPTVTDSRGQCSNGKQYHYVARDSGSVESELWSVSCSSRTGTFDGNRNDIVRLFERQFPDFNDFERGVRL